MASTRGGTAARGHIHYWPDGPSGPPRQLDIRCGQGSGAANEMMFHRVTGRPPDERNGTLKARRCSNTRRDERVGRADDGER